MKGTSAPVPDGEPGPGRGDASKPLHIVAQTWFPGSSPGRSQGTLHLALGSGRSHDKCCLRLLPEGPPPTCAPRTEPYTVSAASVPMERGQEAARVQLCKGQQWEVKAIPAAVSSHRSLGQHEPGSWGGSPIILACEVGASWTCETCPPWTGGPQAEKDKATPRAPVHASYSLPPPHVAQVPPKAPALPTGEHWPLRSLQHGV